MSKGSQWQALPDTAAWKILGEIFAECDTRNKVSVNCASTTASLPSTFCRTLDKNFDECHLTLGKENSLSRRQVTVTESFSSVTVKKNLIVIANTFIIVPKSIGLHSVEQTIKSLMEKRNKIKIYFIKCQERHSTNYRVSASPKP
jgi:hypothetical protein